MYYTYIYYIFVYIYIYIYLYLYIYLYMMETNRYRVFKSHRSKMDVIYMES